MRFDLVDAVLERSDDRIVTLKQVTAAEEYLQDHFPTFPVLPGVMMLEAMVQAARTLVRTEAHPTPVLAAVRALKYGRFVAPGSALRVEIDIAARPEPGFADCKGKAYLIEPGAAVEPGGLSADPPVAVSGRFTLRPPSPATRHAAG